MFLPGGVQALFFVLQRVFNGYFKVNYNFPRFQRGSNIFQGGPNAIFHRNPYNLCFSRGSPELLSPLSGSAHGLSITHHLIEIPFNDVANRAYSDQTALVRAS